MEETISLKEIFEVIKKRFLLIISFTIVAALIAAVLSFFVLTPIYQSSTQFIVNQSKQDDQGQLQVDSGTIRTNVELINTYSVIIRNSAILNEVIEELNLPYSAGQLANNISVSSEQNSQVVTVSVKDPSAQRATDIANATVFTFQERIPELMNVDNVNVLAEAVTPVNPSPVEPNPMLNIAIAIVLGLMIGVGIAFLLEYLDTSIRTEDDIEKKLGLTLIGVITTIEPEDIRVDPSIRQARTTGKGIQNHVQTQKTNAN